PGCAECCFLSHGKNSVWRNSPNVGQFFRKNKPARPSASSALRIASTARLPFCCLNQLCHDGAVTYANPRVLSPITQGETTPQEVFLTSLSPQGSFLAVQRCPIVAE